MMETLKHPHFAPHALLILLDFLFQNRLQCDLAHEVPRGSLAGGILRGRGGQRGSGERVGGGGGWGEARRGEAWRGVAWHGMAWMDRLRGAQRGCTVLVVHVMSRSAICDDHDAAFCFRVSVYTRETIARTMNFPNEPVTRISRMLYCFFLFADGGPVDVGGCTITAWETSENISFFFFLELFIYTQLS